MTVILLCYLFCGDTAILHLLEGSLLSFHIPHQCLLSIAETIECSVGGCSSAVSAIFLLIYQVYIEFIGIIVQHFSFVFSCGVLHFLWCILLAQVASDGFFDRICIGFLKLLFVSG